LLRNEMDVGAPISTSIGTEPQQLVVQDSIATGFLDVAGKAPVPSP